jgi:hypothetical protein
MFGLFKKKEVNTKSINVFNKALKAIGIFILLSEWDKAKKALDEIKYKEKDSLDIVLNKLDQ